MAQCQEQGRRKGDPFQGLATPQWAIFATPVGRRRFCPRGRRKALEVLTLRRSFLLPWDKICWRPARNLIEYGPLPCLLQRLARGSSADNLVSRRGPYQNQSTIATVIAMSPSD